jgi:hypothetical protein
MTTIREFMFRLAFLGAFAAATMLMRPTGPLPQIGDPAAADVDVAPAADGPATAP